MTWGPLRITNVWVKVAYIVAWWAGGGLFVNVVFGWAGQWVTTPLGVAWDLAWLLVGTRAFRASNEPIVPPRPWWQATGRAKASFWLGVLGVFLALGALSSSAQTPALAVTWGFSFAEYLLIAAFYFQSGIRLQRNPRAPRPPRGGGMSDPLPKARPLKL